MKKLITIAVLLLACTASGAHAQELAGDWQGILNAGGKDLRIVLRLAQDDKGALSAKMFTLDQAGGRPFPASSVTRQGADVKIAIDSIGGVYTGKLSADGKTIGGTWTQGPAPLPLILVKTTPETAWEIPAPPAPAKPMAADADPSFEVATIKPNDSGGSSLQGLNVNGRNFKIRNGSLGDLIGFAYNVQFRQIAGAPDWMAKDRYDIDGVPDKPGEPSPDQLRVMVQKLLVERFALKAHTEKREMSAFVLETGKGGPKLSANSSGGGLPGFGIGKGEGGLRLNVGNATMDEFSSFLQMLVLDRPVVNQTAITGRYDFHVTFLPDDTMFNGHPPKIPEESASAPALLDAIQTVGLKLSAEKTQVPVVVIEHVDHPSAN